MRQTACVVAVLLILPTLLSAQKLTDAKTYKRYIDPLLKVEDFGIRYVDDGAGDATVVFPNSKNGEYGIPALAVLDILRLRDKAFPLLIDCLSDTRQTNVRFGGNTISKELRVTVGFVCLDMLTLIAHGPPAAQAECDSDGMGVCMNAGFYFWPDDYRGCYDVQCEPKPWVRIVQNNWRRIYSRKQLRFTDPYKFSGIKAYEQLLSEAGK